MAKKRSNKNVRAVQRDLEKFTVPVKQKPHPENNSKIIGQVMETNQYGLFKFITGNREIKKNLALEKSITEHGIIQPIKVDESFNIIEGQHRYIYAKKHTKPIKYIMETDNDRLLISQISELNSTSRAWSPKDYVFSFSEQGYSEYAKLKQLIESTKDINTPLSTLVSIAKGHRVRNVSTAKLDDGQFSFYNYERFLIFIDDYRKFLRQTGIKTNREVLMCVFNLYILENFQLNRLINKVNSTGKSERMVGVTKYAIIMEHLVDAYNDRLSTDSSQFLTYTISESPKTRGLMTMTGEISDELVKLTD